MPTSSSVPAAAQMLVRDFERDGFVVLRGLVPPEEALRLRAHVEHLSHEAQPDGGPCRRLDCWEGVTRDPELWPLIVHEPLVAAVRALIGDGARYARNSEVHANNAGYLWHRDCLDQIAGRGPDWNDAPEPYRLVRACIYLQTHEESGFRLGVVPGSHRSGVRTLHGMIRAGWARLQRRLGLGSPLDARRGPRPPLSMERGWLARLRPAMPQWISIGLGDAVLLHQRLMHSASEVRGPHYAIYFAYGPDDAHTRRLRSHGRHDPRGGGGALAAELAHLLAEARLLSDADRGD